MYVVRDVSFVSFCRMCTFFFEFNEFIIIVIYYATSIRVHLASPLPPPPPSSSLSLSRFARAIVQRNSSASLIALAITLV